MPKSCAGFSPRFACLYSRTKIGEPAYSMRGRCLFCDPEKMREACGTVQGRKHITQSLKAFRAHYETHSHIYNSALLRVPDEWRETFHAQALKTKRGKSKKPRQRRSAGPRSRPRRLPKIGEPLCAAASVPSQTCPAKRSRLTRSAARPTGTGSRRSSSWTMTSRSRRLRTTSRRTTAVSLLLVPRSALPLWSNGASLGLGASASSAVLCSRAPWSLWTPDAWRQRRSLPRLASNAGKGIGCPSGRRSRAPCASSA